MKTTVMTMALIMSVGSVSWAKNGADDGLIGGHRLISCQNQQTGEKILEFNSAQLQGQVNHLNFLVTVKSRGDEVGEMLIQDIESQNFVSSVRSEEFLVLTLGNQKDPATNSSVRAFTQRGFAQTQLVSGSSGDQSAVRSLSRRGVSQMTLQYQVNVPARSPITVTCVKI